jgi:uncharacterized protein YaaR (DUF327 family)
MEMKISDILAAKMQPATPVPTKPVPDFSFTLSHLNEEGLANRLSALIDNITLQGEKISRHMNINDVKQYRGFISEFINEIVTHSHKFSRENFLDRRGRHRVYGIVKRINENLDELAQTLLSAEKDHLSILDKTGAIHGLLLDLMV